MSQTFCSHAEGSSHSRPPENVLYSKKTNNFCALVHVCLCMCVVSRNGHIKNVDIQYIIKEPRGTGTAGHMLQSTACLSSDSATNAFKNGFGLAGIDSQRCLLCAEEMENVLL